MKLLKVVCETSDFVNSSETIQKLEELFGVDSSFVRVAKEPRSRIELIYQSTLLSDNDLFTVLCQNNTYYFQVRLGKNLQMELDKLVERKVIQEYSVINYKKPRF